MLLHKPDTIFTSQQIIGSYHNKLKPNETSTMVVFLKVKFVKGFNYRLILILQKFPKKKIIDIIFMFILRIIPII